MHQSNLPEPQRSLASLLEIDDSLAADLAFSAPDGSLDRIRASWELVRGMSSGEAGAKAWFVTPQGGGRSPMEIWLTDGFSSFEVLVAEATRHLRGAGT